MYCSLTASFPALWCSAMAIAATMALGGVASRVGRPGISPPSRSTPVGSARSRARQAARRKAATEGPIEEGHDDGGEDPWATAKVQVNEEALQELGIPIDDDVGEEGEEEDDTLAGLKFELRGQGSVVPLEGDLSKLLEVAEEEEEEDLEGQGEIPDLAEELPDPDPAPDADSGSLDTTELLDRLDLSELDAESFAILDEEARRRARSGEEGGWSVRERYEPAAVGRREARRTHRKLTVVAGSRGGQKLLSPTDAGTRPMMGLVRGALFQMLASLCGSSSAIDLPRDASWLDLFAGTGAVGSLLRCMDFFFLSCQRLSEGAGWQG